MSLYQYGSSHLNFKASDLPNLHAAWSCIHQDKLTGIGLEKDTHCTIRYGIEDSNFYDTYNQVTSKFINYINVEIYDVDFFDTPDGDAIYWKIKPSHEILELRKLIEDLNKCIDPTHPTYIPHITIAFVKKGMGADIVKEIKSNCKYEFSVTADSLIITEKTGKRSIIPFTNEAKLMAEMACKVLFCEMMMLKTVRLSIPATHRNKNKVEQYAKNAEGISGTYKKRNNKHVFELPSKFGQTWITKVWSLRSKDDHDVKITYK